VTELLANFHWLRPEWLAISALALGIELWRRRRATSRQSLSDAIAPHLREALTLPLARWRWFNPGNSLLLLILLSGLVAAGPSWRQQPSPLSDDAAALVILLDVSRSMNSTDVAPSRLERSKQKISDLLALVPDKRVGLVVFAGSAHVVLPLTPDHDILKHYLASLHSDMMPRPGKHAEYAIPGLTQMLGATQQTADILLITDGLAESATPQMTAWLNRTGHGLTVFAIGKEDAPIPLQRDSLMALADATDAPLIDDSVDPSDVQAIKRALDQHYRIRDDIALPWEDAGYWLVWPVLMLASLWFRRGWTQLWLPLVLLLPALNSPPTQAQQARDFGPITAQSESAAHETYRSTPFEAALDAFIGLWLTNDQYGRLLLQCGYYNKAGATFDDPRWIATAAYYQQDFSRAIALLTTLEGESAAFAAANARAHLRDYTGARRDYSELLATHPNWPAAETNSKIVQQLIDEIDALSASQPDEPGTSGESVNPEDGAPANGSESELDTTTQPTLTAEQLLASPALAEQWLRGVQQDLAQFLTVKFAKQLESRGVSE
jgi:Ca-activated chloride channel family protein